MRIVYYSFSIEGTESVNTTWQAVVLIIIPCISCVWFCYAVIRYSHFKLYKTFSPLLLWLVYVVEKLYLCSNNYTAPFSQWLLVLLITFSVSFALVYRFTVNPGALKTRWLACMMTIIMLGLFIGMLLRGFNPLKMLPEISSISLLIAYMLILLGMKKYESDRPFPMAGDRPDGRRLRSLDPMNSVAVYIMPNRNGAKNLFKDKFECSNAEKFIRNKREEGFENFGYTHLLLASYVRVISERPAINRFISGQKIYSRGHDVEVSMTIKKEMSTDGSETCINVHFDVNDTVDDVYRKFNEQVMAVKKTEELDSGFDKLAGLLNLIPGLLMKFAVWLLKCLDYFGLLPKSILELSPFHASGFITSMGSLGIPPIYHHLYDFGNIPIFIAFGMKHKETVISSDGNIEQKKYIDYSVVTDDRICDGYYYASSIKLMKRYLNHPERLNKRPETIVEDVY